MTDEEKAQRIARSIRPTIRGCFDPYTKDHFESFVDRLCNDIAKQSVEAIKAS